MQKLWSQAKNGDQDALTDLRQIETSLEVLSRRQTPPETLEAIAQQVRSQYNGIAQGYLFEVLAAGFLDSDQTPIQLAGINQAGYDLSVYQPQQNTTMLVSCKVLLPSKQQWLFQQTCRQVIYKLAPKIIKIAPMNILLSLKSITHVDLWDIDLLVKHIYRTLKLYLKTGTSTYYLHNCGWEVSFQPSVLEGSQIQFSSPHLVDEQQRFEVLLTQAITGLRQHCPVSLEDRAIVHGVCIKIPSSVCLERAQAFAHQQKTTVIFYPTTRAYQSQYFYYYRY
jgi:hypothetical protein